MRTIGNFLVAVAEVLMGLLVLAYVAWGECCDRVSAWARRRRTDPDHRRAPGRSHRPCTCRATLAAQAEAYAVCRRQAHASRPSSRSAGISAGTAPARLDARREPCLRS